MTSKTDLILLAFHIFFIIEMSLSCKLGYETSIFGCIDTDECATDDYDEAYISLCGDNADCNNTIGSYYCKCKDGYKSTLGNVMFTADTSALCKDINECDHLNCGPNAKCHNAVPHYSCTCNDGFHLSNGKEVFHVGDNVTCRDIDECQDHPCGQNSSCINTFGSYSCECNPGYRLRSGQLNFTGNTIEQCEDICEIDKTICGNGTCHSGANRHYCACHAGFTNYGKQQSPCTDTNECATDDTDEADISLCRDNADCINTIGSYYCKCKDGYESTLGNVRFTADTSALCKDINECDHLNCGPNAKCHNAVPHYSCTCNYGFHLSNGKEVFHVGDNVTCRDRDECQDHPCGQNSSCINTFGSYSCECNPGYRLRSGQLNFTGNTIEQCEDICEIDKTICGNGTCHSGANSHYCACHAGFTNYGKQQSPCTELNCHAFMNEHILEQTLPGAQDLVSLLRTTCLELTESKPNKTDRTDMNGDSLLESLLSIIDELQFKLSQSSRGHNHNRKMSAMLDTVETALRLIGPLLKNPQTKKSSAYTELELLVQRGAVLPQGPLTLSSEDSRLDILWETAAGEASSYPGFTTVSLLSYKNLEDFTNGYFSGMKPAKDERLQINSKVVTATVSNTNTNVLGEPVKITFYHLKQTNESSHVCVYWETMLDGGTWSSRGCSVVESNSEYTVCSCSHLSSFAVLMALYEIEDQFELQLITWVGLSVSLLCLFMCILTFSLIRSIHSPRNTIHLHLSISLFVANVVFLAGISRTENQVGCAVIAGLLHFFYLAAFCWMCLEGIQLYRMVIMVFNTTFKTLYLMAGGYGVPALIVVISAVSNHQGYGTKKFCWLNLEGGFIWSFFGPACVIIMVNIFFFLITVWKLAQKFSSLNPDLNNLHKIKAFTVTAVAQLCVLGTMWIFGCFQFDKGTMAVSYLFTILNSLQGALLFIMHCLLSKQIREEYGNIFSRMFVPQKKKYSDFTSSLSSKAQTPKSSQNTGESHI